MSKLNPAKNILKNIIWKFKSFSELDSVELYKILALRQKIFMLEQGAHYLDADGKDLTAIHFMGKIDQNIAAYARLILPASDEKFVKFGRVIVSPEYRNRGYAKQLIQQILDYIQHSIYKDYVIKISAQSYLQEFYKNFDFECVSELYSDAGIAHINMVRNKKNY